MRVPHRCLRPRADAVPVAHPRRNTMAVLSSSLQRAGFAAFAIVVLAWTGLARAENAPPAEQHPAATTTGPRSGAGRGASTPASPATAEQHKLPPDSTTR